jgi:hypothetical protein
MKVHLRSHQRLSIAYTYFMILYLFILVGYVFGCIFYGIDTSLIEIPYYGRIEDNPTRYYQGMLLGDTTIYSL